MAANSQAGPPGAQSPSATAGAADGPPTADHVCTECGEHNAAGVAFCTLCGAFLAWDDAGRSGLSQPAGRATTPSAVTGGRPGVERSVQSPASPRTTAGPDGWPVTTDAAVAPTPPTPPGPLGPPDSTEGRFRISAGPGPIAVPATGEPAEFTLGITNTSTIVDGYHLDAPDAPGWLQLKPGQVELLPDTEGTLTVRMRVVSTMVVPAQQFRLLVHVRSLGQAPAHADLPVVITVPAVDIAVRLRPQPQLLRAHDRSSAEFTVVADNTGSNRPARLTWSGSDPELAVTFRFEPAVLDVGPGASDSVRVSVTATGPEPGAQISRLLTVTASEGARSVDTLVTLQQSSSVRVADPLVTLEVEPGLLRVRDTTVGVARVVADNTGGAQWAHLQLKASDPERVVRAAWSSPQLHVPPGQTAQVEIRFEAPLPEPGTEVSRTVTIAGTDGRRTSTAVATIIWAASASPMTTLALHVEPSVVRVRDADGASVQVTVDNQRGRSGVRVFLGGTDPERVVRFTFTPAVVELRPGEARTVTLALDSWRPQPGQETTHPFTLTAGDGASTVETTGSLVQATSRSAIETLAVRLDPSVLRLANRRRGRLRAVVDNRGGAQPVRVSLQGDDPENIVRFGFAPGVLDVAPGRLATAVVTVSAPRPSGGLEVTRPISVTATDGRSEVQAEGSVIQSVADRRPLARVLFTLLGALAMIVGSFRPWLSITARRGVDFNAALMPASSNGS